jgi:hypothetical protein
MENDVYTLTMTIESVEGPVSVSRQFKVVSNEPSGLDATVLVSTKEEIKIEASAAHTNINMYAVLRKEGNRAYQFNAVYNKETEKFDLHANLKDLLIERVNGDYKLELHAHDFNTNRHAMNALETIKVDFIDGSSNRNNLEGRADFKLYGKIVNIFDEEPAQKSALIPTIFAGLIGVFFVQFFFGLYSNGANFSDMSFWGMLFSINFLVILGVIVAFWIKINLVITLWVLLALTPVTLFMMNKALTSDNCHISGFGKKLKSS